MILSPVGTRRRTTLDSKIKAPRLGHRLGDLTRYRQPRISSVAIPGKSVERIKINVSGKKYELTYGRLFRFPKSLLARSARREEFYDTEKDEYFFDRNRMAFESVYYFYQTAGEFLRPEHIPDDLLMKEMQFYGLLQYLSLPGNVLLSVGPSKVIVPGNKYQRMVWELFENPSSSIAARLVNAFMLLVIILSIIMLCIETLPNLDEENGNVLARDRQKTNGNKSDNITGDIGTVVYINQSLSNKLRTLFIIETFCIACFSLELIIRFLASAEKRRFLWNLLNLFDLLAVLPFYLSLAISSQSVSATQSAYTLRILRLARLLRLAKIYRYSSSVQIFVKTIRECVKDFLLLYFLILMTTTVFASASYYFEQEHEGTNFVSIPAAFWWAIITLTSVGYGDMVPVTLAGKINGAVCVVFGVIVITPLLPIIGSKFNSVQEKAKIEKLLTSEKLQISDDDSSESSEDWRRIVTFAEEEEFFEIPLSAKNLLLESQIEHSVRPRPSVTVI